MFLLASVQFQGAASFFQFLVGLLQFFLLGLFQEFLKFAAGLDVIDGDADILCDGSMKVMTRISRDLDF
ncbi:MAG TPA: hypothetical protein VF939_05000 [Puia sp.]